MIFDRRSNVSDHRPVTVRWRLYARRTNMYLLLSTYLIRPTLSRYVGHLESNKCHVVIGLCPSILHEELRWSSMTVRCKWVPNSSVQRAQEKITRRYTRYRKVEMEVLTESESLLGRHPPALGAQAAYQFVNREYGSFMLWETGRRRFYEHYGSWQWTRDDPSDVNSSHIVLYFHQHHSGLWPVPEESHKDA